MRQPFAGASVCPIVPMENSPPPLPSPSIPEFSPNRGKSAHHTAGNVALICLVAATVFSWVVTAQTNQVGGVARIVGVAVPVLLWLGSIVAGAIALAGVGKHGTNGLRWKGLVGVIVPIALTLLAIPAFLKVREVALHKKREAIAAEISKGAPAMVDAVTRLENAVAGPGDAITINMTVLVDKSAVDMKLWDKTVVPEIRRNVHQSAMERVIREGTTVIYAYKDKNGAEVAKIVFDPKDAK